MRATVHAILATGDSRLEYQLQTDTAVQKTGPADRDLGLHSRLQSIAPAKDDVCTAHHSGFAEAVQRTVSGCGFVPQLK
jgi:hypothetical protein